MNELGQVEHYYVDGEPVYAKVTDKPVIDRLIEELEQERGLS